MTKSEYLRREAVIISTKRIPLPLIYKIKSSSVGKKVPFGLLYAIVLIETTKRPSFIRLIEKLIFSISKFCGIHTSLSLGVFQYTYKTSETKSFWMREDVIIVDAINYINQLYTTDPSLLVLGRKYNGSVNYGVVLENVCELLFGKDLNTFKFT